MTFADDAIAWFDQNARDLPWRQPTTSPWGVLVSEVMLQQTPVVRVEPAWRSWMTRWPTPADLAADPPSEAIRMWGRLGYPRRAMRLHACAVAIVERHDGVVPDDSISRWPCPGSAPIPGGRWPPSRTGGATRSSTPTSGGWWPGPSGVSR